MRIGFFTDTYLPMPDGVATSVETCARALEARGHEVYIIAPRKPRYVDKRNNIIRLTSIKFLQTPEIRLALNLPEKSFIKVLKIDFDIVHGHSGGPITFLGWQVAKTRNIPYIATYHTLWNRYTHYFLRGMVKPKMLEITTRIFGNLFGNLIAPTTRVKKELLSYGVRSNIYVLPSGIDLEKFSNNDKDYLRKKLHVGSNIRILLYVGRLGPEKSVDFIIKAFTLIKKEYSNTVFAVAGSGPEMENLKELAGTLGIKNSIFFLGNVKHSIIPKVYAGADLFMFASKTETQGMVVFEALASGLPVVLVEDQTFKGVIENGKNGFMVKKDAKRFASKVKTILNNEKKRKQFSDNARKSARKFAVEITAKKLEKLYIDLISEKGSKTTDISARRILTKIKKINIRKLIPQEITL